MDKRLPDSEALYTNQDTKMKRLLEASVLASASFLAISVFPVIKWLSSCPGKR